MFAALFTPGKYLHCVQQSGVNTAGSLLQIMVTRCANTHFNRYNILSILSSLARLDRNCVLHVWRETVKIASGSIGALVPAVSPYWGKTHTSQHSIIITASGPQAQLETKPDPRLASWEWCGRQLVGRVWAGM